METEFRKVTQIFQVRRKKSLWDKFLNFLFRKQTSLIQDVEINFLYNASSDIKDIDIILSGLYITETKLLRKEDNIF